MVRRDAYRKSGGHEVRTTMHNGLMLPQLFRRHGLRTDIADLTHLATCRMYHATEVGGAGEKRDRRNGFAGAYPAFYFPAGLRPDPSRSVGPVALVAPGLFSEGPMAPPGRTGSVSGAPVVFGLEIPSTPAQRMPASARRRFLLTIQ